MFVTPGSRPRRRRISGGSGVSAAGPNTAVQFNNAGILGGDAGFTYSGISGGGVNLGSSVITGALVVGSSIAPGQPSTTLSSTSGAWQNYVNNSGGNVGKWTLFDGSNNRFSLSRTGLALLVVNGGTSFSWASGGAEQTPDTGLYRDAAAGLVSLANITTPGNACTFRVYNTVDNTNNTAPTNYERGVFDWTTTANSLTIGTQAGGTGTLRNTIFVGNNFTFSAGGLVLGTAASGASINLKGASGANLISGGSQGAIQVNNGSGAFTTVQGVNNQIVFGTGGSNQSAIGQLVFGVIGFQDGSTALNGWMNWRGQSRVTSDFSVSNSTTLTAISGISGIGITQGGGGRTYKFEAWIATAGSTAGGISIGITFTSTTFTSLSADGFILDGNTVRGNQGVITSTATPVVNSSVITSSAPTVRISGLVRAISSGTFGLTLAQSTANATAVVVSSGSWLEMMDIS